jgi:hypothetical protein
MNSVVQDPALTPRTTFIISFIQEAIKCGGQYTRFILQFMPPKMVTKFKSLFLCIQYKMYTGQEIIQFAGISCTLLHSFQIFFDLHVSRTFSLFLKFSNLKLMESSTMFLPLTTILSHFSIPQFQIYLVFLAVHLGKVK